jgi:hypothetical protein
MEECRRRRRWRKRRKYAKKYKKNGEGEEKIRKN